MNTQRGREGTFKKNRCDGYWKEEKEEDSVDLSFHAYEAVKNVARTTTIWCDSGIRLLHKKLRNLEIHDLLLLLL